MEPCEKYLEMISAMIDGELNDTDREELMAHVLECDDCRRALDAFSAMADDMRELAPLPGDLCGSVMSEIAKPKKKVVRWQRYAALAACLVLVCAAGLRAIPGRDGMATALGSTRVAMFTSASQEAEAAAEEPQYSADTAVPKNTAAESGAPMMPEPMPEMESSIEQIADSVSGGYEYAAEPVSDADLNMVMVDEVVLNSLNFSQLSLNSRGVSYKATEDEAKYLLSNLNYGREADAPAEEPDITIDLSTGETVELWENADGIVCRLEGLTFAPAGDPEIISDIIDEMTE